MDSVVKDLINYITLHGNKAFTLEDVFPQNLLTDLDHYLSFTWSAQLGGDSQQLSQAKINEIKRDLFAGYLQSYFEKLVQNNTLKVVDVKQTPSHVGSSKSNECHRSALTKSCQLEVYQLTEPTKTEVNHLTQVLTLQDSFARTVGSNQMEPFQFTSTFLPILRNKNKELL